MEKNAFVPSKHGEYIIPIWKRSIENAKHLFTIDNKRLARKMPQALFIECLIEHFNIMYEQKKIVWPRRKK